MNHLPAQPVWLCDPCDLCDYAIGCAVPDLHAELLRALHDEHADPVFRYVVGLTNDRARSQDVVHIAQSQVRSTANVLLLQLNR